MRETDVEVGVAEEAQAQPERPDVFVSYSRADQDFVRRLTERLEELGKDVWVDWEDIRPTAEWWERIRAGIEAARAYVTVLSPDFAASKVCEQELEQAVELNKRVVPIVRRETGDAELSPALAGRNWIFFRETDEFEPAVETLVDALDTDLEWLDAHARLLVRAGEWERNGRDRSFLLRGSDLSAAERWLAVQGSHRESATPLQAEYVVASRQATSRRQRITIGAVLVGLAVAVALAIVAILQRNTAIRNEKTARSRELAAKANAQLATDPQLGVLLAVEAARASRTPEAEDALRTALSRDFAERTLGHGSFVENARFDRLGRRILTVGDDTARLWDAASGRQLQSFRERDNLLNDAALSPGGRIVGTAGTIDVSLWDVASGKRRIRLGGGESGHQNQITQIEFSPDGRLVATGSVDYTVRIWNAHTGTQLHVLKTPIGEHFAFSRDGKLIVTTGDAPAVWSTRNGRRLASLRGHERTVERAVFSPDGRRVATASDDATARLWNARTGRLLRVLSGHGSEVIAVAFDATGKLLATGSNDATAAVWDVTNGRRLAELRGHASPIESVAFSPDSHSVLTASDDATARVWDIATSRSIAELLAHRDALSVARFSLDGRRIVTASEDGTARTWRAPATGPSKTYVGRRGHFGAGGDLVVTTVTNEVAVYDRKDGESRRLQTGSLVFETRASPDGRLILSADDRAILWDARTGARPTELESPKVQSARFSADGKMIALGLENGTARLYRTGERRSFRLIRHSGRSPEDQLDEGSSTVLSDAEFSPDGRLLVTARAKTARVWDVRTGRLVSVFRGHPDDVSSATFSPDGTMVASVSDSGARLWDARTGRVHVRLRGRATFSDSPAFGPDGRRLMTIEDKAVRIRDVTTGGIVLELRIPAAIPGQAAARFSRDGRFVVTGDRDSVRVWDALRGSEVETFVGSGEEGVDFSADNRLVLGSREDSTSVYACELCRPLDSLLETAKRRVLRSLTADERRVLLGQ